VTLLPGTRYLIDTSALARTRHPDVAEFVRELIDDGVACTCATVDLEVGYSARNPDHLKRIRVGRAELFITLPLTQQTAVRAAAVQQLLAERGLHRAAGAMDLLTAAVAEEHRAVLLHYDADFEHIAAVTGQRQQWIVARGSLP
jgi:predicted nucleic acid-binding protein